MLHEFEKISVIVMKILSFAVHSSLYRRRAVEVTGKW